MKSNKTVEWVIWEESGELVFRFGEVGSDMPIIRIGGGTAGCAPWMNAGEGLV